MMTKINLNEKFGLFTEHWRPKVVAALNGQEVKIIKVMGEFPWHLHEHEDELFLVWKGNFRVEFRDHCGLNGARRMCCGASGSRAPDLCG
jgi:hypothetical protein